MNTNEILYFLEQQIHSVIMATVDDSGLPVTCAIDIMDSDEKGLYFLTAKGKGFYNRLKKNGYPDSAIGEWLNDIGLAKQEVTA